METPHFSISFHQGEEESAKSLAPFAEKVYETLTAVIRHKPDLKTNVVLLDSVDYGNGFTTVVPDPRVTLYLTDWSTNLNPSKYDLWLKFVFLHEYVHVLHLDIVEGGMTLFRMIFGRVIFPNGIEPMFMTEGMAVYFETKYSEGGRGKDPRWQMMMRMDVLEDNIKSIDQASVDTVLWPMGHLSYLYGVEFFEYLSQTYGEDKLITLAHVYGDFLFSMGVDGAFLFTYRKHLSTLWEEWLDHLNSKFKMQKAKLGKLTEPKLLTRSGYYNLKPKWSKGSDRVFYQQNNADNYPNIRAVDLKSGQDHKIFEGQVSANNLSLDPAGKKLLFSKLDIYRNYYTYRDLYSLDLATGRLKRLTEGMRVSDADLSPDGAWLVLVENKLGTNTLMMMTIDGEDKFEVCSPEANAQYFSPRWSPDGKRFVVAKWSPGGEQKLYLVEPQSGIQRRVTKGESLTSEANPVFSPAGDYIFFDSDRTGIVNLYAYHLGTKRLFQVTNVIGGAMMPDVSPDGKKLAYVSYSSKGYDIAVMDIDPKEWMEIRPSVSALVTSRPSVSSIGMGTNSGTSEQNRDVADTEKRDYETHDYNPWPTFMPKFWLPYEYFNENGSQMYVYTLGSDILDFHDLTLGLGYDFDARRLQYLLRYINNQFLPQIAFMFTDTAVSYGWEGSTLWMREGTGLVSLSLYDNRVFHEWDRQAVAIGYEQTNITNISSLDAVSARPSLGNVNGVFLAWRYLNARQYAKSISPEDGMDLALRLTLNSSALGSGYTYTTYSGNLAAYFSSPLEHHVLVPTLYGFYSKGDQLAQSNFSWRYLPIRGYPSTNLMGNKGALLSTEYCFPIAYLEKGLMYGYNYFDRIWGDLFYDIGGATSDPVSSLKLKRSYGAELNVDCLLFWYAGLDLGLGYVKGMDEDGEEKFYITVRVGL